MGGNTAPAVNLRLLPRTPVSRVVAGEVLLNAGKAPLMTASSACALIDTTYADLAEADGIESIVLKIRGKSKA